MKYIFLKSVFIIVYWTISICYADFEEVNINTSPNYVYKLLTHSQWNIIRNNQLDAQSGTDLDKRDGYIHLSTAQQVWHIGKKYFSNVTNGILLKINFEKIQPQVTWEPNSKGELYPHLYGILPEDAIVHVYAFNIHEFDVSLLES